MAFHYSPKIITDGLVLCLDAANQKSYPQSGTAWFDLSRGNNATFSSLTYSSSNNGSLEFDGLTTYCQIPYNNDFDLSSTDYTLEGWFNLNSSGTDQYIISNDTFGSSFDWCLIIKSSNSIGIYSNSGSTDVIATVPTIVANNWYNFTITSISTEIKIYLNSILYETSFMSTSNDGQSYITIGCASWNNPNYFLDGRLSSIRVYRKGLTQEEVSQNYNAIKPRFGL